MKKFFLISLMFVWVYGFCAPESNKVFGIFVKASLERSCFPSMMPNKMRISMSLILWDNDTKLTNALGIRQDRARCQY